MVPYAASLINYLTTQNNRPLLFRYVYINYETRKKASAEDLTFSHHEKLKSHSQSKILRHWVAKVSNHCVLESEGNR